MKTVITIEVEHSKPLPNIAELVAGRAWSIDGVTRAEVVTPDVPEADAVEPEAARA